jgi:hypothetical protein
MTLPALLFALLVALFYGLGHLIGIWRGWTVLPLGALNLGLSSLGSVMVLIFGDWLSRIEAR